MIHKIKIPFNKPSFAGRELDYIKKAVQSGKISGDGIFNKKCVELMEKKFKARKIFLAPSGTGALEITSLLLDLKKGDEVIAPSFTFTSTVNAFILRGAKPIFVDVRQDTLNIDESKLEDAITSKTKAIYCTHYAGVSCEMKDILRISKKYKLPVIEDAAQGVNAKYKNQYLGTIGDFGAYSFHETKNFNCGEGGAVVINNAKYIPRTEIIREKGTNRSQFFRGTVDKYTWHDLGSSFLLSEISAAYLYAQLENMQKITRRRKRIHLFYVHALADLQIKGKLRLPIIPENCTSNYHLFYVLFNSLKERNRVMDELRRKGILTVFHYLPLHTSPMGKRFGYKLGQFPVTEVASERLLRLPLYNSITQAQLDFIVKSLKSVL